MVRMWLSFIRESTEMVCVTMKASQKAIFFITNAIEEEAIENQVVIQENVDDPSHGTTGATCAHITLLVNRSRITV